MATTYDKASLVMIPSGYKDDKLYSVKPTDGSGDFTFSRDGAGASPATRVNATGLIEKGRENVGLYSADQTNWTDQFETSVTANAAANPLDGAVTADKVIPSVVNGDHYRGRSMAIMSGVITASMYIKADGYSILDLGIFDATAAIYPVRAVFDLSDESITFISGSIATINSVGGGWYRVSITALVPSSGTIYIYHRVRSTGTSGNYSGDGTSGMLLFGSQLEEGLVATDYIETTTAPVSAGLLGDMPRLDYSGGATCPSLLLEPSRTNMIDNSEYLDGAPFKSRLIVTDNAIVSPEGLQNAGKIVATSVSGSHALDYIPSVVATDYSMSIYAKAGELSKFLLLTNNRGTNMARGFDLINQTTFTNDLGYSEPTSYSIEAVGNDWYRCTINFPKTSSGTAGMGVYLTDSNGAYSFVGNDVDGMYFWGWQLEAGSYPTSYIPTYGSASTRGADSALGSFNGDGIFSSNWTAFCELVVPYEATTSGTAAGFTLRAIEGSTTNSNWSALLAHSSSTELTFNLYNGVSIDTNVFTYNWGTTLKVAVRYDGAYFINGTKYTSSITPQEPVEVSFGRAGQANASVGETAEIKQTLAFPTALTDAECIALTTI